MLTLAPIFIVGCPRSGTTLLQHMLDAHPAVAIAPETRFVRHFWFQREQYGPLDNDDNYRALIQALLERAASIKMELDVDDFCVAAQSIERSYPNLFNLLLCHFGKKQAVLRVGEKTPQHLLHMQTLQEFFPQARFIHIIRDPRAVVSSWRKVPWSRGSIHGDARVWQRYMATAQQFPPTNGALHTLHYEALITNPEASLQAICDFLDLPFDKAMLNYHRKNQEKVNIVEPWKSNASKPINPETLTLWQQEMSAEDIATVELIAKEEMAKLGYATIASNWQLMQKSAELKTRRALRKVRYFLRDAISR